MKDRKLVYYEELSGTFKRSVVLAHLANKRRVLFSVQRGELTFHALNICYEGLEYTVLIKLTERANLEWETLQELQIQEETESLFRLGFYDDLTESGFELNN